MPSSSPNRQLQQLEPRNIPPDPGDNHQGNHSNITSSTTPLQLWFYQNVHPLVTPMRILCFSLSLLSFLFAYGFFMGTHLYRSHICGGGDSHRACALLSFVAANGGHTLYLISLLFFSFWAMAYEKYRHHYLLKSLGEYLVMLLMTLLILGIGHDHHPIGSANDHRVLSSKVAGLATCEFLTIDALCIINLLTPGHHYALLEATATLTLHLALVVGRIYLAITANIFVFVVLVIKNFLWRNIGAHGTAPTDEWHQFALGCF